MVLYSLDEWLGRDEQTDGQVIEFPDKHGALAQLRAVMDGAYTCQCGGCDSWIYTAQRPQLGVLECSVCGDAGVDFIHATTKPRQAARELNVAEVARLFGCSAPPVRRWAKSGDSYAIRRSRVLSFPDWQFSAGQRLPRCERSWRPR